MTQLQDFLEEIGYVDTRDDLNQLRTSRRGNIVYQALVVVMGDDYEWQIVVNYLDEVLDSKFLGVIEYDDFDDRSDYEIMMDTEGPWASR